MKQQQVIVVKHPKTWDFAVDGKIYELSIHGYSLYSLIAHMDYKHGFSYVGTPEPNMHLFQKDLKTERSRLHQTNRTPSRFPYKHLY